MGSMTGKHGETLILEAALYWAKISSAYGHRYSPVEVGGPFPLWTPVPGQLLQPCLDPKSIGRDRSRHRGDMVQRFAPGQSPSSPRVGLDGIGMPFERVDPADVEVEPVGDGMLKCSQ